MTPPALEASREKAPPSWWVGALVLLAAVDFGLARVAYWTLGAVPSGLWLLLAFGGNLVVLLVSIFGRLEAALSLSLAVTLVAAPVPLEMAWRLRGLEAEGAAIARWAVEACRVEGAFPGSLEGYDFDRPELRSYLAYRSLGSRFGLQLSPSGSFDYGYSCTVVADGALESPGCQDLGDWFFSSD